MIRGLEGLGIHNEVVTLDDPQAAFLTEERLLIHTPGKGMGAWYYSPLFIPWLQENYTRFDIVIVHGLWQFHGFVVQKVIRQMKKNGINKLPAVYIMPHGMLDPYFQSRRRKAVRNWCYWKLIENKMVNGADAILFTCCEEQRLAGLPFRPYAPRRAAVVGLGVQQPPPFTENMQKAFLAKCHAAMNRNYLLFLGRIDKKKGVDLLVTAYKVIAADYARERKELPMLVIAGPGLDTSYGEKIQQMVEASPLLQSSVVFTGMIEGDAKWGAFYSADAFILPSHQENFGIALVEAMACSKPVLISNKVNIWQEVISAQGGLAANDTAAGILMLLTRWTGLHPEKQERMAVRAWQCYEQHFSVEIAARQLLQALDINPKPASIKKYVAS